MKRLITLVLGALLLAGCAEAADSGAANGDKEAALKFAQCMRENGMPDYPDPDAEGHSRFESGKEPDPNDPDLKAAHEKCAELLPGGGGGGPVIIGGGS